MSLLEPRLSDLRAGFGGYGFSGSVAPPPHPLLPLWRPPVTPATSWCMVPSCPCSVSRSYLLSELYDYTTYSSYSWPAWYLKAAQDPLYKGLPLVPPPQPLPPRDLDHHRDPAGPHVDSRSSPGKELLTKHHKQERLKERLELTTPLNFDKDHALQHQHRGARTGSPTQVHQRSSSPPEHYRNGDSSSVEGFPIHHQLISSRGGMRSPPSHPPPRYPHMDLHHEGPLNLSLTNPAGNSSSSSGSHSPTQSRPSVITCANLVTGNGKFETSSNGSASPVWKENSDVCDPAIEEHFRRSLGKNYSNFLSKAPSVTPSPPPSTLPHAGATSHPSPPAPGPPSPTSVVSRSPVERSPPRATPSTPVSKVNTNVSITGCVDDHFARALGDSTWSALKAKADPAEAPAPGSVDDHFAKALGDTWLRIKAERESPRGPPPPFPLPPYQSTHQITHPLPHHRSLPHPIPQRPPSPSSQSHGTSLLST